VVDHAGDERPVETRRHASLVCAPVGKPSETEGEDVEQENPQHEERDGRERQHQWQDRAHEHRCPPPSQQRADQVAEHERDERCQDQQTDGPRQRVGNEPVDGGGEETEGVAEVEGDRALEELSVLDEHRVVEAEPITPCLDHRRRVLYSHRLDRQPAHHRRHRVPGHQPPHGEDDGRCQPDREHEDAEAAQDVSRGETPHSHPQ
jgi:hypothetical protein